jgi:hypothetical protein
MIFSEPLTYYMSSLEALSPYYEYVCDAGTTCAATKPLYEGFIPTCCGKPMRLKEK